MCKCKKNNKTLAIDSVGKKIATDTMQKIVLQSIPSFVNNTYVTDAQNDNVHKMITLIRQSMEYKQYMRYLKQNMNFTRCMFLPGITSDISTKSVASVQIDIHHTPFKLDDIVRTICNKHIIDHGYADEFKVGDEVMALHYRNLIGLVPVSKSCHEMIHHDEFDVHPALVYGMWKQYIEEYKEFFTDTGNLVLERLAEWDNTCPGNIPQSLEVKYTLIQYDGLALYNTSQLTEQEVMQKQIDYISIAA